MSFPFAVIFDMDGTLVDNNPYHALAWQEFCRKRGMRLTTDIYSKHISGKSNTSSLEFIFERELEPELLRAYSAEKELLYRQLYKPYVKPVRGLIRLLEDLSEEKVPIGIATSAIPENISFLWEQLPMNTFFHTIVDSTMVENLKPHPESFLKVAEQLEVEPEKCLVFEDCLSGLKAAKAAGMKVVGLTTALTPEEMEEHVDATIDHYDDVDLEWITRILQVESLQQTK